MSKILRKILTASSALLMIAGVGTTAGNANVNAKHRHARTHRVYKHHRTTRRNTWYAGAPKILRHNSQWLGSPYRIHSPFGMGVKYERNVTPLGGKYGYNPTPFYFKGNHHFKIGGSDAGAAAAIHPHTKYLGHGYYRVKSYGDTVTIKVHNRNNISIWMSGHYQGTYHRISNRTERHFEYHPYF